MKFICCFRNRNHKSNEQKRYALEGSWFNLGNGKETKPLSIKKIQEIYHQKLSSNILAPTMFMLHMILLKIQITWRKKSH